MFSEPHFGTALPICPLDSGLPFHLPPHPKGVSPPLPLAGLGYALPPSPCLTFPGLTCGPALPAELRGRDLTCRSPGEKRWCAGGWSSSAEGETPLRQASGQAWGVSHVPKTFPSLFSPSYHHVPKTLKQLSLNCRLKARLLVNNPCSCAHPPKRSEGRPGGSGANPTKGLRARFS